MPANPKRLKLLSDTPNSAIHAATLMQHTAHVPYVPFPKAATSASLVERTDAKTPLRKHRATFPAWEGKQQGFEVWSWILSFGNPCKLVTTENGRMRQPNVDVLLHAEHPHCLAQGMMWELCGWFGASHDVQNVLGLQSMPGSLQLARLAA